MISCEQSIQPILVSKQKRLLFIDSFFELFHLDGDEFHLVLVPFVYLLEDDGVASTFDLELVFEFGEGGEGGAGEVEDGVAFAVLFGAGDGGVLALEVSAGVGALVSFGAF